ncbi:YdgA family protein [Sutterella megalosphaeroides]|uniref:Uncharacterized protein n=1 Tax=Sutterella megalosphaeroides TaxID=2494234 RepID=A0A2Z6IA36_9BURK|nr:hypothetical protein [Sutterella megalosphaeroides]BBF23371.1 hypothetical protein SUTMEG_12620 [Sutterella megalosphaeroides]
MLTAIEFLKRHSALAGTIVILATGAVTGLVVYQKSVQSMLLAALAEPGAVAASVIVTTEPRERGLFTWRDRASITIGSSVWSPDDPSAMPVTFEFDIVAHFGILGLSGEIHALNSTGMSATLYSLLKGIRPHLSVDYRTGLFSDDLTIEAEVSPFDVQVNATEAGVGPIDWLVSATSPVRIVVKAGRASPVTLETFFDDFRVTAFDPARNRLSLVLKGGEFRNTYLPQPFERIEREWFMSESEGVLSRVEFDQFDPRGHLNVVFDDLYQRVSKRPKETLRDHADDYENHTETLDGDYAISAKTASLRITPEDGNELGFDAGQIQMSSRAENVPVVLFETLDEDQIEREFRKAGTVSFHLDELSFLAEGKKTTATAHFSGNLTPKKTASIDVAAPRATPDPEHETPHERAERRRRAFEKAEDTSPDLAWSLTAEIPDEVLESIETLLSGKRRGIAPTLRHFLVEKPAEDGSAWSIDFRGDIRKGATLNGRNFSWEVKKAYEATPDGFVGH